MQPLPSSAELTPDLAEGGHATAVGIGVDIGGTKIAAGTVMSDGRVADGVRVATPQTDTAMLDVIREVIGHVSGGRSLPVGCGFPGMVSADGRVIGGPNVPLANTSLAKVLSAECRVPVIVENDAAAAAWAEFRFGAGRSARSSMAMITLGTGVGGGLVLDGQLYRGANGFAAEVGRLVLRAGGRVGPGGIPGEVEAYCSGTALRSLAAEAVAEGHAGPGSPLRNIRTLTADVVADAAAAGDPLARQLLDDLGDDLGVLLAGLVNLLDIEMIVIGGGLGEAHELFIDRAGDSMRSLTMGLQHRPPVPLVPATLGSLAGLVGAGALAAEAVQNTSR